MNVKKIGKRSAWFILNLLFLDSIIFVFAKIQYFLSRLLLLKEWRYNSSKVPLFYKHQLNYNFWRFNPSEWSFTLRGVYAREKMFPNCKVLDLCCGDGSYSFLFFSGVASHIDAIDYDSSAIRYAKKYYNNPQINFQVVNAITEQFPAQNYDIVVWNAGICYFTLENIHLILAKIVKSGKPDLILSGMTPKANGHVDHKTEFKDTKELKTIFDLYFNEIDIKEIIEGNNSNIVTFYFNASKPKFERVEAIKT